MSGLLHDFLYLIWKDPRSRRNYIIGKLTKGDKYYFEYCGEYKEAQEAGWNFLEAFPEEKRYESDSLFAAFLSRLPDAKRKGIEDILLKYNMHEFDGYELLRKSTGRLPIDTYEFIDPIFQDDVTVQREFFIVGIRHVSGCEGMLCSKMPEVEIGEELALCLEPTNKYDSYAVKVMTLEGKMIGYIPRYYSKSVASRLSNGMTYSCIIIEIQKDCENCIRVVLEMPKKEV